MPQIDPKSTGYADLDESAQRALVGLTNADLEQAGVILQSPDGRFYYTQPSTSSQHDHFEIRVMLQKGWKIAGIYHTHPGKDQDGQVFSPNDLDTSTKLGVPSYIKFMKDGSVRKYIPGKTETQNKPDGKFKRKVATGDLVTPHQPDEQAQYVATKLKEATP